MEVLEDSEVFYNNHYYLFCPEIQRLTNVSNRPCSESIGTERVCKCSPSLFQFIYLESWWVDTSTTFWRATLQLLMLSLKNVRTLPPFGICRKYQPGWSREGGTKVSSQNCLEQPLADWDYKTGPNAPHFPVSFQSHLQPVSARDGIDFNPLNRDWPLTRFGQWNMVEVTMCQFQVLASGAFASSRLFSWTLLPTRGQV